MVAHGGFARLCALAADGIAEAEECHAQLCLYTVGGSAALRLDAVTEAICKNNEW